MFALCHPSYQKIEKLGCKDPVKVTVAFYVYIELCEAKRYWDVKYKYHSELDIIYLEVQRTKNSTTELCVPWPVTCEITLDKIEKIQRGLNSKSLTLVFKSEDSTSVMYEVTAGLVKPIAPEESKRTKEKVEKKLELQREIKKNIHYLYEQAISLNNSNPNESSHKEYT